jgi:ribonuclease Z
MSQAFQPRLINGPLEDPGLYVLFNFQRRALIFDLGTHDRLTARELLKVTDVFISHAHLDHFVGFDNLLRVCLHRPQRLRLFGPAGFADRVEGKLKGYTWNLTEDYPFVIEVWEVESSTKRSFEFYASRRFQREKGEARSFQGILWEEEDFTVWGTLLDHRIPCLGFTLEEREKIQVRKEALESMHVQAGPWLTELKKKIRSGYDPEEAFEIPANGKNQRIKIGELIHQLVLISKGQKISYVVDALYSKENIEKISGLAKGSDTFFCEASFLQADKDQADLRYHLTARQAGELGYLAGVKELRVFHFSPRYAGRTTEITQEAMAAFRQT